MTTKTKPRNIFVCKRCNKKLKGNKAVCNHAKKFNHYEYEDSRNEYLRVVVA
jgi:hypothetical protein